jgi:hypothetical protein
MSMWEVGFIQMGTNPVGMEKALHGLLMGTVQHTQISPSGDTTCWRGGLKIIGKIKKGGFEMLKHERCQSGHAKHGRGDPILSPAKR